MTVEPDFEDRIAARLLGVSIDADTAAIKSRFRSLVRDLHPDGSVSETCVDLGRLAYAKDRLVSLAERRAAARRAEASRLVEVLRVPAEADAAIIELHPILPPAPRGAFDFADRIGQVVDVAG